jgi:hypothetical protein
MVRVTRDVFEDLAEDQILLFAFNRNTQTAEELFLFINNHINDVIAILDNNFFIPARERLDLSMMLDHYGRVRNDFHWERFDYIESQWTLLFQCLRTLEEAFKSRDSGTKMMLLLSLDGMLAAL